MSELPVHFKVPYRLTFVRRRCRNPETIGLSSDHAVGISTFCSADAPVAYRIWNHSGAGALVPVCSVRIYEGRYWWPLLEAGRPVSSARFVALAGTGDRRAADALDCDPVAAPIVPENEFFASVLTRSTGETTLERQKTRADHAARRIGFCDDIVVVAAGQPLYYAIRDVPIVPPASKAVAAKFDLLIGSSSQEAISFCTGGFALPGPRVEKRRGAAARGMAFEADELPMLETVMRERGLIFRIGSRIERLAEPPPRIAAETCARAAAERLWRRTASPWREHHEWLGDFVPTLANARLPGLKMSPSAHLRILEELVAVDWPSGARQPTVEIDEARAILRRVKRDGRLSVLEEDDVRLAPEDDAALASLGP